MELWRGVHRALGIEPFRDLTLSAEVRRWDYLENLTGALSACAPALVVLEDVHWSDPTAIWVLQHLPRALDNAPIAFIATSRDHEVDMPPLEDLRRASRVITLNGLDVDAVHQLAVAETAGSSDSAIDAVDLHARTGGNPLFVQELVRSPGGSGVDQRGPPGVVRALRGGDLAGPGHRRGRRSRCAARVDRDGDRPVQRSLGGAARAGPFRGGSRPGVARRRALPSCVVRRDRSGPSRHPRARRAAGVSVGGRGRPRRAGLGGGPPGEGRHDRRRDRRRRPDDVRGRGGAGRRRTGRRGPPGCLRRPNRQPPRASTVQSCACGSRSTWPTS